MNILHIYRGYGDSLINPVIDNQIASLSVLDYSNHKFILNRGGVKYLTYIVKLRRIIRKKEIDIIHSHYSFSGFFASFGLSGKPVICSLMGSDVYSSKLHLLFLKFFSKYIWRRTIVKSKKMQKKIPNSLVIPNGVDFQNFSPKDKVDSLNKVRFDSQKNNVVFIAVNSQASVKNLALAEKAIESLNDRDIVLHKLSGVSFEDLPYYYSAADLMLMTSLSEGSPNVIKEAMACNCPIVSTDVGDVDEIISTTKGCFITSFEVDDVVEKIGSSLLFLGRTTGRNSIKHLDSRNVSKRILSIYNEIVN